MLKGKTYLLCRRVYQNNEQQKFLEGMKLISLLQFCICLQLLVDFPVIAGS